MGSMLSRRDSLALLLTLGIPVGDALAADHAAGEGKSRVTFENDRVRVVEYVSAGGSAACGTERHYHPAHLTIYLTLARIRGIKDDGTSAVKERKAGEVAWFDAGSHAAENVGSESARLCMVELKDKEWKPSTGTAL